MLKSRDEFLITFPKYTKLQSYISQILVQLVTKENGAKVTL